MPSDNWYDESELYDIAFGWDTGVEIALLNRLFARNSTRPVKTVFEPFCGSGRLMIPMAAAGFRMIGADVSEPMLALASRKARRAGVALELHRADVASWTPPRCDAIVTLIDSFRHLHTRSDAAAALRAWARACGVVVIGLSLESPDGRPAPAEQWESQRDGVTVQTTVEMLNADGPDQRVMKATLRASFVNGQAREITTESPMAAYSYQSFAALAQECGLRVRECLSWRSVSRGDVAATEGNVVAVLTSM
ncbi:MAG: methyltransferase domain-containing protein [Planctomycetes bacterium]|nr:methyltransferase domain-containing protein [Planctomycetota bacterium]